MAKTLGFLVLWLIGSSAAVAVAWTGVAIVDNQIISPAPAAIDPEGNVISSEGAGDDSAGSAALGSHESGENGAESALGASGADDRPASDDPAQRSSLPPNSSGSNGSIRAVPDGSATDRQSAGASQPTAVTGGAPGSPTTSTASGGASHATTSTSGTQVKSTTPTTVTTTRATAATSTIRSSTTANPTTTTATSTTTTGQVTSTTTTVQATSPPSTKTFHLVGGSAAFAFSPGGVQVLWATPKPGFDVDIGNSGPDKRVEFEADHHESRLEVWWDNGPKHEIRERRRD